MQYTSRYSSPIGAMTMASDGVHLIGLWFDNQKYFASTLSEDWEEKELEVFTQTKKWLDIYFAGEIPNFVPKISLGSPSEFRALVWEYLKQIPYGQTVTYGEIAKKVAGKMSRKAMSSQAVGGAVGHNPISIIIPCHRVVGTDGKLTGYAGGLDKKTALLAIEKTL